jgi:hypothetical protein
MVKLSRFICAHDAGIEPVSSAFFMDRYVSEDRLPMLDGSVPSNTFSKFIVPQLVSVPKDSGMTPPMPVSLFNTKNCKLVKAPRDGGTVPPRFVPATISRCKAFKDPMDGGIEPMSPYSTAIKISVIVLSAPKLLGRLPCRPLLTKLSDTGTLEALHTTPKKSQ